MDCGSQKGQAVIEFVVVSLFLAALLAGLVSIVRSYRSAIADVSMTEEQQ